MKLTDLTYDQLEVAFFELSHARSRLISRAFGDLEVDYFERADLLDPVIDCLKEAVNIVGGASDGI